MSRPLAAPDILFQQRLYRAAGLYDGKLDGAWGPKTDAAAGAWAGASASLRALHGSFDLRTETLLQTILPVAQRPLRQFLVDLRERSIDARVISGTRTYAEQDALYRQGRGGRPGLKITNARGGQSNHCFGIAADIGIFQGGRYLPESPLYQEVGELSLLVSELEWGGLWNRFPDRPHYQLATGLPLTEVRRRFEAGLPYVPEAKAA